jgi:putative zinc finger protein
MSAHLTMTELRRWKRGELPPEEVIPVGRHLAECPSCASAWEARAALGDSVDALREQIDLGEDHPDLETELFKYADGLLSGQQRAGIEQHLEHCKRCREDVEDLIGPLPPRRRAVPRWIVYAAAAAIVILAIGALLLRNPTRRAPERVQPEIAVAPTHTVSPPPKPPPVNEPRIYERAEWNEIIRRARAGAPLVMPAVLQTLRQGADPLRGTSNSTAARLTPDGIVVETTRPAFTWPPAKGALYAVYIFDGMREVAHSDSLTTNAWTPPHDLPRGVTYTWQVDVEIDGTRGILPTPPAPPARFHILDRRALADLETARKRHGDDHLLLALLYARAGLDARAAAELALVKDAADAATAKRLLGEVRGWKRE